MRRGFTLISKACKGFTLIELLVTIAIIGLLVSISVFGVRQAQTSARDGRRKADLESIAIALELYRSDCNSYPASLGSTLVGNGTSTRCSASNVYLDTVPTDPQPTTKRYAYSTTGSTYNLCASLEEAPNPTVQTTGCTSCVVSGGGSCNWKVSKP